MQPSTNCSANIYLSPVDYEMQLNLQNFVSGKMLTHHKALETQIDTLVYALYGLMADEIKIVEGK